ncbi:MAG: hypothetical protein KGL39_60315 [Patescibacteria group bacterium]|nr:hypothetical protein [Patescibacteria group bacterium]
MSPENNPANASAFANAMTGCPCFLDCGGGGEEAIAKAAEEIDLPLLGTGGVLKGRAGFAPGECAHDEGVWVSGNGGEPFD